MKKINVFDQTVVLTKRKGQKTLRLSFLKTGEVHLSMPYFCNEKKALLFLKEHLDWVKKNRIRQAPFLFKDGNEVSILGIVYQIKYDETKKTGVEIKDGVLFVGGEKSFLHRRIVNFAKKELLKYIDDKAHSFSLLINRKINRISLKDTTSRWGSCSTKNNLNFCYKLAFAPLFVIDYLIAHEVAHLKEMNHSDAFWKTVALMPVERAKASNWLRKNGKNLIRIK